MTETTNALTPAEVGEWMDSILRRHSLWPPEERTLNRLVQEWCRQGSRLEQIAALVDEFEAEALPTRSTDQRGYRQMLAEERQLVRAQIADRLRAILGGIS